MLMLAGSAIPTPVTGQQLPERANLQRLVSIGVEEGQADYEFTMVSDVAFLPSGVIAVADVVAKNVRLFSRDGAHLATLGRQGSGPGEFHMPVAIAVDSVIRVFDLQQNRVAVFSFEGDHITTRRLPTVPGHSAALAWPLPHEQIIVKTAAMFVFGAGTSQANQFVLLLQPDGAIDTLGQFLAGATQWHDPGPPRKWSLATSRFGEAGAIAVGSDLVAFADGYEGTVRFWSFEGGGALVDAGQVQLPNESRPVEPRDLREVESSIRREYALQGRVLGSSLELRPPPRWSIAQSAFFASEGVLWVRQHVTSDRSEVWTRVTPDGIRGSWMFPPAFEVKAADSNIVAGVQMTDTGTPVVVLYELSPQRASPG